MNDLYYRIYLNRDNKLCVVEMQSFDEGDYNQNKFLRGEDMKPIKWETEEGALDYLNSKFRHEFIDDDSLTPNNISFQEFPPENWRV